MVVVYKQRAKNAILKTTLRIEANNTAGSGNRWFNKLDTFIHSIASAKAEYGLCKAPMLAKYKYSCYTYGNWVIAFKIKGNNFEVCRFIFGKRLKY